ncbi:MAG TPA: histidine kinase [Bryobacteraceae bacterium]|jgi:sensor histidine kinase YesM|nr:histidine kinase [Bryobacteraceae bacterium]
MTNELKLRLRQYAGLFLVWTALGLFLFSQAMVQKLFAHDPNPWWHHLTSWMVGVYVWLLLTPTVLWLGRRFPLNREHWIRRTITHTAFGLAIAIIQLGGESAILYMIGVFPTIMTSYAATLAFLLIIAFHQAFLTYWIILAVQFGFGWYARYIEGKQAALRLELRSSQLESQLTRAHLSALKMQLQPHFLFNTLNAIMVLVRQQKSREAEEMLGRLSDLLRCVLDDVDTQEVPLRRELEYLQLYLSIEEVRFQDRLRVEVTVDPEAFDASVPHMVLQPIVENAIRHGVGRSSSAGEIRISARRVNGVLEMEVQDDGPGLAPASADQTRGIGLANTRARLAQLYGDAASLSVQNDEHRGVKATVVLPYRVTTTGAEADWLETRAVHDLAG